MYLTQVFKKNGRDPQYTPLHVAAFIGYVEEALKILQQDPSQALSRDAEGFKPRERLRGSIISQSIGEDAYLDPDFATRTVLLERMLLESEIQASGGLLRLRWESGDDSENETYVSLMTPKASGANKVSEIVSFKLSKRRDSKEHQEFRRVVESKFPDFRF